MQNARCPCRKADQDETWTGSALVLSFACGLGSRDPDACLTRTLFTKAGPDGTSLGDCPFSHSIQMALKLKGVDYDVVPCTEATKPAWLTSEVGGQMPCVVHAGVAHVETKQILGWIEQQFPGPSLAVPEEYVSVVERSMFFPELAAFTKNTDSSKDDDLKLNLQMALTRLRTHLFSLDPGTRFMAGDTPSLLDCELMPKLYVLQNATKHFKGYSLDDLREGDDVRMYYERVSALPPFAQSCYPPDVCIWGWQQARGG